MPVFEQKDFYFTIDQSATAEFKDRGSRFIAFAFPVTDPAQFKSQLLQLKKEHPKAVHHCFAYRMGFTGDQFRTNDDGEPSGSAGKPILGQIDSKALTNVAIIVVRYFGGTLLGVPGLINAYKTVSSLVLQMVPLRQRPVMCYHNLQCDYTSLNDIMLVIKQSGCEVVTQDIQLFVYMKIGIPKNRLSETVTRLGKLRNVELSPILS